MNGPSLQGCALIAPLCGRVARQMVYTALLGLPDAAVAATLGVNSTNFAALRASTPKGAFIPMSNDDCLSRCNLANTAQAPQPNLAAASVASGR